MARDLWLNKVIALCSTDMNETVNPPKNITLVGAELSSKLNEKISTHCIVIRILNKNFVTAN